MIFQFLFSGARYFEKQFELAHALKLPMFLHMREAASDFCDILDRYKSRFLMYSCLCGNLFVSNWNITGALTACQEVMVELCLLKIIPALFRVPRGREVVGE